MAMLIEETDFVNALEEPALRALFKALVDVLQKPVLEELIEAHCSTYIDEVCAEVRAEFRSRV